MIDRFRHRVRQGFTRIMPTLAPRAYVFGLYPWQRYLGDWLPGETVARRSRHMGRLTFHALVAPFMRMRKGSRAYVWGYKVPPFIEAFCRSHAIPVTRIEDGFLRSVSLGATRAPPLSLCFDRSGLYFDATMPSDLETLLQTGEFTTDAALMTRAREGIARLVSSRLSKYNTSTDVDIEAIYGQKKRKRILVLGQVEGDASIEKGCIPKIGNNDLVRLAAGENPDGQIIFKPHPAVLRGTQPLQSDPKDVAHLAMILDEDITLADAFQTVDHVYTITSLSGFEALLRGIPVTCAGMPFYAGWGSTDDRQPCPRRTARRSIEEIFAAAYILYPRYFDPVRRAEIDFERALDLLAAMKQGEDAPHRANARRVL